MADKNPAAVALGKRRATTLTSAHQSAAGKAAANKLTKQQRSARASKAAIARHTRKSGDDSCTGS